MEKRVFLAIFLSFIVLAAYQAYFAPTPPPRPPAAQTGVPTTGASPATPPGTTPGAPAVEATTPAGTPAPAPIPSTPIDPAARDVVVETDSVRAVFSTAGATLKSWRLKKYLDGAGEPLDLVPTDVPGPRPFTIGTDDAAQSATLAAAIYQPSAEGLSLGAAPGTLTFQYRDAAAGLSAEKRFYFQPDGKPYLINVEAMVDAKGSARPVTVHWGPALGRGVSPDGAVPHPPRVVQFRDGSVERLTAADLAEKSIFDGVFRFSGVEEYYFVSVAVIRGEPARVEYKSVTLPVAGGAPDATRNFIAYSVTPKTEATPSRAVTLPFFMGPKDYDLLRGVDGWLENTIDFGMFAWLVRPLLGALKWINRFVGNFGWSIVILTILINVIMFPLRHRSMVSMRKMQALQPEIKSIQERYAKYKLTDPERQKMNQEMMALYKQKGVNPASGCLPMLLTLPVLFAFYAMLSVAIELRGAPFLGWIKDLSARDPLYITPFLMGATMLWQTWLTPSTADPMQKRIFMLMPIIFTITFLTMPAGLVLYWTVSNLMAIGQQLLTNRLLGPAGPPVRPVPVPAPTPTVATRPNRKGKS